MASASNLELRNFMDGNVHSQEGIVNEEERSRKREKNIKRRRKARVCIVVNFLNSHFRVRKTDKKSAKTAWELRRTESLALR